ncbi:MAG: hypothetical protein OK457_05235 [Thaumarchaeota archaeon]|nr:hypothetical protein [Nitrososphaerota archaeon]
MSIIDVQYRTITCNTCGKTVTFNQADAQKVTEENPWLKTVRIVQTAQGRNFVYDSDVCEIEATGKGAHNPEERKQIVLPEGTNAMQMAAAQAAEAEKTTDALRRGAPVTVRGN